ncbi:MAG TPA: hypothetical protein DEQ38_05705 [Elusimicrobia bacterium]|nr:MAG: hypothetical protein A2089_06070 [Elusimicrobia bacterium GWD2_63_28]HCC47596.1 hypothetical protein [Elusimicrobiota bacterium]
MAAEALHIELLHSCPSACLACDHRLAGPARLPAAALEPVFAERKFRELGLVSFSGGEPLLHPELGAIMRSAAGAFPAAALVLLTSLHDGEKAVSLLRSLPPALLARLHVGSSLDGPQDVHDSMRGLPDAFARLKTSLALLKKEFPRLSTGLTFTATRRNAAHFYDAWLEAEQMGSPLGLQFLVPNANTEGLELRAGDRKKLAAALRAVLARARSANLEAALTFLESGQPSGTCGAGRTFFMLSPEGQFYLCPFHKEITAPLSALQTLRPRLTSPASATCKSCFLRCAQ